MEVCLNTVDLISKIVDKRAILKEKKRLKFNVYFSLTHLLILILGKKKETATLVLERKQSHIKRGFNLRITELTKEQSNEYV